MNQDQVKERLLSIDSGVEPFTLIFSGKTSKRVDGLYKPETREIIIHNKNMGDDDGIMYTAIHEFAHHIQFTRRGIPVSSRCHTKDFYSIFHSLLAAAEERGLYQNIFKTEKEFKELTEKLKNSFLRENGELMKEFGRNLVHAFDLCKKYRASFEDYVDRELNLGRTAAKSLMRVYARDIDPEIGYENMKFVASIPDADQRAKATEAFKVGKSQELVREEFKTIQPPPRKETPLSRLTAERDRLNRTIKTLTQRLSELEKRIAEYEDRDIPQIDEPS